MELLLAAMTMRVAIRRAGIPSLVISSPLTLDRLKARALQSYLEALAKNPHCTRPPSKSRRANRRRKLVLWLDYRNHGSETLVRDSSAGRTAARVAPGLLRGLRQ